MIEREVRYRIDEHIKKRIINSSAAVESKNICVDLCMGQYGFDSLDKLGYIIRLREKAGACVMESKRRLANNSWQESSVKLNTIKDGYDFLINIGLKPYLYINRKREIRSIKEAKIFIDEIDLLGTFVEFELEDGYNFKDLEEYLELNGINSKPEKLYGDIFKERMQGKEFKLKFNESLSEFLNNN